MSTAEATASDGSPAPPGAREALGRALRDIRETRVSLARQEQALVAAARLDGMSWGEIEACW